MNKRYDQHNHFYTYSKFLDKTNAQILTQLAKHGPRNISTIAKTTNLPVTTVNFRLKKLIQKGLLKITANPNLPRLGLAKAFFVVHAPLGQHKNLLRIIKSIDYWTYIIRCYGKADGYCAYLAFPAMHKKELDIYLQTAAEQTIIPKYTLLWTTNSHYATPNFQWYNFKEKRWKIQWQQWVSGIQTASGRLPKSLKDTQDNQIMADKADLLIIKELEKDATTDLNELAKLLKITPQAIGNRYKTHIIQRNLISNYNVDIYPFPLEISELYNFTIDFENQKNLAKFVNASNEKPFIVSYTKTAGKNTLIINIYIERKEFPNLIDALNQLHADQIIKDFTYITLEPTEYHRQTISYEYFEKGQWAFNTKEKIRKLQEVLKTT